MLQYLFFNTLQLFCTLLKHDIVIAACLRPSLQEICYQLDCNKPQPSWQTLSTWMRQDAWQGNVLECSKSCCWSGYVETQTIYSHFNGKQGDDLKFNRCLETISEDAELCLSTAAWWKRRSCCCCCCWCSCCCCCCCCCSCSCSCSCCCCCCCCWTVVVVVVFLNVFKEPSRSFARIYSYTSLKSFFSVSFLLSCFRA